MKPRLLVCIPFLTPSIGGGAFVFFNILKHLIKQFDVYVVYFQEKAEEFIPPEIPSYLIEKQTGKARYYFQYPKVILQASRLIKEIKPDVIIGNLYQTHWIFLIARFLARSNAKLITGEHNNLSSAFKGARWGRLRHFLVKKLDPLADLIIVPSKGISRHLIDEFNMPANKIAVINNPVVTDNLKELSKERVIHTWLTKKDVPVILSVGVIDIQKDPITLLRAFSLLQKQIKTRCIFLGDGPMLEELKKLAKDLRINEDVAFLGFEKNPFKFMANADVLVLSSIYEGFGNVIVEAMACGCPVVSTRCPHGPEEIITDGINGLLSHVGNVEALANNMLRILKDDTLKKSLIENGYRRAMDFTAAEIADNYIRIINKCLQN